MLEYEIKATRVDAHGSVAHCKQAEVILDTDLQGRVDAFNPAELLLAAVAACILKNMERIAPMIQFEYRGVKGESARRTPGFTTKMTCIEYEIDVDSSENDHKLALMHENIQKFGTVYNTVEPGTVLKGVMRRIGDA